MSWFQASATDAPGVLLQYGALGAVALLAISALWALYQKQSQERDRERERLLAYIDAANARGDRLEEELAKLNAMVQTQTMSALHEATRAVSDAITRMNNPRRS